jgi:hypothetical protein
MDTVQQLERRRDAVLEQMGSIRSMRSGTVNEQYLRVPHKGRPEPKLCGPYFLLTRKQAGRTVSQRLTSLEQVSTARADIAAHKRFVELCKEFERLTEQLGQLERAAAGGQEKKRRS